MPQHFLIAFNASSDVTSLSLSARHPAAKQLAVRVSPASATPATDCHRDSSRADSALMPPSSPSASGGYLRQSPRAPSSSPLRYRDGRLRRLIALRRLIVPCSGIVIGEAGPPARVVVNAARRWIIDARLRFAEHLLSSLSPAYLVAPVSTAAALPPASSPPAAAAELACIDARTSAPPLSLQGA
jgi:hypothetical protein